MREVHIVAFLPTGDYEANTRRRMLAAVAAELRSRGRGEKMLCVERPVCPISTPIKHPRKYLEWITARRRLRQVEENVWAWTPWVFIHDIIALKRPWLQELNMRMLRHGLVRAMRKAGISEGPDIVAWAFHPYEVAYLDLLVDPLRVYECWDDHQEFPSVKSNPALCEWIGELEQRICARADLVFATSRALERKMSSMHGNVVMVPNGVDFKHFNAGANGNSHKPEYNTEGDHPRIGFVGKINEKLDLSLLDRVSAQRPEWIFTIVGPFDAQPRLRLSPAYKRIHERRNVRLTGPRPYQKVPAIVSSFDVCTIPFVVNDLTRAIYPLKLHEYLAAGKPVVSTDLPEVRQFEDVVYIARNAEEFEQMIERALAEDCPELRQRRIEVARQNSWEVRAKAIVKAIDATL